MTGVIGASAELVHLVQDSDGAAAWGNDMPVLATPVLLWLGEIACMRALDDGLANDEMTLGVAHDAEHLAPTPVGQQVCVRARLASVDGRRLRFDVVAEDGAEVVYRGTHDRAVVSRSRFGARVAEKRERLEAEPQ